MTWHVTARMAWHDRKWDGRVCDDPAANTYCIGSHSLLSERLAREKRVECETPCAKLDAQLPDYQPPCFWTSAAFADAPTDTLHRHPFSQYREEKAISEQLPAHSVYTWPFRLSITHASKDRNGQYFPDLEKRIGRYAGRLHAGRSLIFFYLNYDNPVSADDYKYALVGCARLTDLAESGDFPFAPDELAAIRGKKVMKNFPTINWALRLSHGGPEASVRLPYHEYLKHVEDHPQDERLLEEIRVLVDDPALLSSFKYVSEQLHDDHALALLYKMKRSLARAEEHGLVDVAGALDLIEDYLADCWADRGLYPGLGAVVNVLADLAEGEAQIEGRAGAELVDAVRATLAPGEDLLDRIMGLLEAGGAAPDALAAHKRTLRDARAGFKDNKALRPLLRKLALFTLTPRQVARILFPDQDDAHAFGGRAISAGDIAANPYLLAEAYVPSTLFYPEDQADLDREQRTDGEIDYAVIDIGMFPDRRYLDPHEDLQDLTVAGPERLRAFAIEALRGAQAQGHSFVSSASLAEHAAQHPLFYRDKLAINESQLLSDEHLAHFRGRLHIECADAKHYFYLQEAWDAEQIVTRFVTERLKLPEHKVDLAWLPGFLDQEAAALVSRIADFEAELFTGERARLMSGALTQRLYCVTGRPGSGKSQAVAELLSRLERSGEATLVLAPTGKAALRLNQDAPADASWEAQTIDRWIWRVGLADYLEEGADLKAMKRSDQFEPVDNIIVDEMSMVNLFHLALLFRALEIHQPTATKRVILVGDENQLPPIGCGKPFQDIIAHLRGDRTLEARNHVRLTANCRQEHDRTVLDAAHLFAGKNRYHDELFGDLCKGGRISEYLNVGYFSGAADLEAQVTTFIEGILDEAVPDHRDRSREQAFNLLLRLYDNGYVPQGSADDLGLDRVQILTPYRGGPSGALGLSEFMRSTWRAESREAPYKQADGFVHSDKIVRISNYYGWNRDTRRRELRLSNGSVGVLCKNKWGWSAYFPESERPLDWDRMDSDDFELAYGLTVHKAQGSEFEEVLVVVPERRALLSRELIYTAMTRSKTKLTLLVEKSDRANPLRIARDRSVLASRNSSVFARPFDAARLFEPEAGKKVKSKIEYLIYSALVTARESGALTFDYESALELPFGERMVTVHPDFVIQAGGRTFYWEHLGMLDAQDYARDWRDRLRAYEAAGLKEMLLTTDDMSGVRADQLTSVIDDLIAGKIEGRADLGFSLHHYTL